MSIRFVNYQDSAMQGRNSLALFPTIMKKASIRVSNQDMLQICREYRVKARSPLPLPNGDSGFDAWTPSGVKRKNIGQHNPACISDTTAMCLVIYSFIPSLVIVYLLKIAYNYNYKI